MEFSERDIEDYLFEHIGDIECDYAIDRQVPVGVGIIDILALRVDAQNDQGHKLVVVEIKKERIDCNAVGQVTRYAHALGSIMQMDSKPVGLLVGRAIDPDALLLCRFLGWEYHEFAASLILEASQMVLKPLPERMTEHQMSSLKQTAGKVRRWLTTPKEPFSEVEIKADRESNNAVVVETNASDG